VERLRAGEDEAFDGLVRELWTPAVRFVLRATKDVDAAEDVVQDAFVLLYEHREDLDPTRSVRAYLYQTIRNRMVDRVRRAAVRSQPFRLDLPRPSAVTPLRGLEGREIREAVERAIETLPDRAREAFDLAYLQDLTYREVAEVMGISIKTVGHHISAALAQLRQALAPLLP
jgi:RNA polymerase sigma-70 factor (ECF subfamily)